MSWQTDRVFSVNERALSLLKTFQVFSNTLYTIFCDFLLTITVIARMLILARNGFVELYRQNNTWYTKISEIMSTFDKQLKNFKT